MNSRPSDFEQRQNRLLRLLRRQVTWLIALTAVIVVFASVLSAAQVPDAETVVNCPALLQPDPLTPYGFAHATLESLQYARQAAESIAPVKENDDMLAILYGEMAGIKTSTNDFICAKRALKPLTQIGDNVNSGADARAKMTQETRASLKLAATGLAAIYDAHMNINQRILELLKKELSGSISQSELADQLSTLKVESEQRWDAFFEIVALLPATVGYLLRDTARPDPVHPERAAHWLVITKSQKQALLESVNTLKDGAAPDSWPAQMAHLYLSFFNDWKSSDEPY